MAHDNRIAVRHRAMEIARRAQLAALNGWLDEPTLTALAALLEKAEREGATP